MKVLMLGWESSSFVSENENATTLGAAGALAKHVNLSLILPEAQAHNKIKKAEVIGLNTINLSAPQKPKAKPETLPYANDPYIRTNIPLYGIPAWSVYQAEAGRVRQAGESISVGTLKSKAGIHNLPDARKEKNIFAADNFNTLSATVQILQFARHTNWLAGKKNFDIIYAYHWKTYLAATELKLSSGKKLMLQVHSLSPERGGPDCNGWVFEIEKQAFEKADAIIAANRQIASVLEKDYGIMADKIKVPGEAIAPADIDLSLLLDGDFFQVTEPAVPDMITEFLEVVLTQVDLTEEKPLVLADKSAAVCKHTSNHPHKHLVRVACIS